MAVHTRSFLEIANLNKIVKDHTFALFNFGTLPLVIKFIL